MTQTQQVTLADFLLARIAEDEALAQDAAAALSMPEKGPSWHAVETADEGISVWSGALDEHWPSFYETEETKHISRWSPGRVLDECEARRRIVADLLTPSGLDEGDTDLAWAVMNGDRSQQIAITTLRLLALPYADHSDYRSEWRV
jgi:hypothetical protein